MPAQGKDAKGDGPAWRGLDKDLDRIGTAEHAARAVLRPAPALALAVLFVALAAAAAAVLFGGGPGAVPVAVIAAAALGATMALAIGANDIANTMGPAVGARAITMGGALALAAVCESAGALLAGGDVVATIAEGLVDPAGMAPAAFVRAMAAALVAAGAFVHLATVAGAPVSTTHAIVGAVVGAGVAAAGVGAVDWPALGVVAVNWTATPLLGGAAAAALLAFIEWRIARRDDLVGAARTWVPLLVALMAAVFAVFMALTGLGAAVHPGPGAAAAAGAAAGLLAYVAAAHAVRRQAEGLANRKRSLKTLFALPLVVAAALLSFAHGANDVANAVGPLAAIVHVVRGGAVDAAAAAVPGWVMAIGAFGISLGLFLFGPRLIATVGEEITRLNPIRAWCVALATALTVLVASALGLPVSTTHIAVGAVFGIGFFREWSEGRRRSDARREGGDWAPEERRRRLLVRRSHFLTIVAAWAATVPAAALLGAAVYALLDLAA